MLLEVLLCVPVLCLLWFLIQKDPEPLCGVYSQPGRLFIIKKLIFRVLLTLRRRKQKRKHSEDERSSQEIGYGMKSHANVEAMECPQKLSDDPMAVDAVYFNAMGKDGTCFVLRIGRRHGRQAEIWLSVDLPGLGFYQSPVHPDTTVYNTPADQHCAAGLRFDCLEPMSRWRVTYNGLLRKGLVNDYSPDKVDTVHVTFSFIWSAFTDMYNFDTDIDADSLATAIAREKWTNQFWDTLKRRHQTHYEQWGELRGSVRVEGHPERQLTLRGCRDHSYGIRDWRMFHRYIVHFGYLEDGSVFHVNTICWTKGLTYLQCGYYSMPNATMLPVDSVDLNLEDIGEGGNPPQAYSFSFTAGGKRYNVEVRSRLCPVYYHHEDWGNVIHEKFTDFTVNDIEGYGITEFCYARSGSSSPVSVGESYPLLTEPTAVEASSNNKWVVPFTDPACCCAGIVGGKGCQLAMLTQLQAQEFVVPQGFCVTLAAFEGQLKSSPDLATQISVLQDVACGRTGGVLETCCKSVTEAFQHSEVCDDLQTLLVQQMTKLFGEQHETKLFAVRSSAAGEDSADMSAAGQMDTFLGVKGHKQVFEAVCKCWASQFALPAVEYRRQHGQPVSCGMGVVVQEMVPATAAGVLFTQDPVTGSPATMVLNANYGLGESVVSGEAEPDTIHIHRTWDDQLSLAHTTIGRKVQQIYLNEDGGTVNKHQESTDVVCCLPDDVILKIARIGVELEKRFSDPRDIEFAVKDGTIYLLQARPITTLDQDSELELLHEFDTPLAHDREIMTTCNIGEMMPSAMTPLTLSTFLWAVEVSGQEMYVRANCTPHVHNFFKFTGICGNMGFINMHFLMAMHEHKCAGSDSRMAQLSVMGEVRDDFTIKEIVQYHGTEPFFRRIKNCIGHFMNLYTAYGRLCEWEKTLQTYNIASENWSSAQQLYDHLCKEQNRYIESWTDSFHQSASSGSWASILTAILSRGKAVWTTGYYSDVAMMLSHCEDVYSADVPAALQRLAAKILSLGHAEHFMALSAHESVEWLQSEASGEAGSHFKRFLSMHGHRCVKEAEFLEKSWQTEPHKVTSVIQNMLRTGATEMSGKKELSVAEAISSIKTPTTFIGRQVLKWALPKARRAVGHREWGKSVAVKMTEVFKQAYWKLANLFVLEGRLPREELLFFLTHQEIGQLLKTRSGKLVSRAQRRWKLYPKQLEMKFARITRGHPAPIAENGAEEEFVITSVRLEGMPVSIGVARGKARVVKTLTEAGNIQRGEILIVPFTDVGWSPYFPLIAGLVTEIGGLLSHGAVVAREYGLPCIVNVPRATSMLKTGDEVMLDGTAGVLQKLEESSQM